MAEGVGNAPTSAMPILFSGQVQPAYICLPSVTWSGWRDSHPRPPGSEPGRLLLTLHPEIGCQGWTRTNTVRFNKPSCYFDTTWQFEIGAAGRTSTCIVPFRRRMPHVFDHGSNLKMVSAAGIAPAVPRSQAECVGCYATRWFAPMDVRDRVREKRDAETLGIGLAVRF